MSTTLLFDNVRDAEVYRGSHYYVRGGNLDLRDIIRKTSTDDPKRPKYLYQPSYIHIYCDKLTCSGGAELSLAREDKHYEWKHYWGLRYIHIYARSFLEDVSFETLRITGISAHLSLRICFDVCKPNLKITCNDKLEFHATLSGQLQKELAKQPPTNSDVLSAETALESANVELIALRQDSIGFELRFNALDEKKNKVLFLANNLNLDFDSFLSKTSVASYPEYFSVFLHNLFEEVVVKLASNERRDGHRTYQNLDISRLRFIFSCSKGSSGFTSLAKDAYDILRRLDASQRYSLIFYVDENLSDMRLSIPRITPDKALAVLNTRLDVVKEAELKYDAEMTKLDLRQVLQRVLNSISSTIANGLESLSHQLEEAKASVEKDINNAISNLEGTTNTILQAIATQVGSVTSLDSLHDDSDAANKDVVAKSTDLMNSKQKLDDAYKALQTGFKEYKDEMEKKFIMDCITAVGEICIGVGVGIATAGSGGPATAGFVADAVGKVGEGVTKWMQVKTALKKIAEVAAKVGPKLIAIIKHKVGEADREAVFGQGAAHALEKATELIQESKSVLSGAAVEPVDFLGIMADWEEFKIDADDFFEQTKKAIGSDSIKGLTEYHSALLKLVVRGETLLQARLKAQDATVLYQRKVVEAATLQARKAKIEGMKVSLKENHSNSTWIPQATVRVNLLDDLSITLQNHLIENRLGARRSSLLALYDYCVVSMYENCLAEFPALGLSSDMTTADFKKAVVNIQDAVKLVDTQDEEAGPTVKLDTESTLSNFPGGANWRDVFRVTGKIYFSVSALTPDANHHYHLRLSTAQLELVGVKLKSEVKRENMEYGLNVGPFLQDRRGPSGRGGSMPKVESEKDLLQYTIDPFYRRNKFDVSTFKTKDVEPWVAKDHIHPPLFCSGSFEVDAEDMADLDTSGITRCKIELTSRSRTAR